MSVYLDARKLKATERELRKELKMMGYHKQRIMGVNKYFNGGVEVFPEVIKKAELHFPKGGFVRFVTYAGRTKSDELRQEKDAWWLAKKFRGDLFAAEIAKIAADYSKKTKRIRA